MQKNKAVFVRTIKDIKQENQELRNIVNEYRSILYFLFAIGFVAGGTAAFLIVNIIGRYL